MIIPTSQFATQPEHKEYLIRFDVFFDSSDNNLSVIVIDLWTNGIR